MTELFFKLIWVIITNSFLFFIFKSLHQQERRDAYNIVFEFRDAALVRQSIRAPILITQQT